MDVNQLIPWAPGTTLDAVEKQVILLAFRFYRGNKTATANALGIAIRTLDNKLERYQAEGQEEETRIKNEKARREQFLSRQRGYAPAQPNAIPDGAARNHVRHDGPATDGGAQAARGQMPDGADEGLRVESSSQSAEKSAMPLPQRKEVQGMPSQSSPKSHSGKSR